ncbi:MAG: hypothetical protein LBQ63_01380 [Deltaproteobacteria bacterium]|nr:hypothetical protein [Deltaproteobacteria bacterium]
MSRKGCLKGLERLRRDFPVERNLDSAAGSPEVVSERWSLLREEHGAWCGNNLYNLHERKGCRDLADFVHNALAGESPSVSSGQNSGTALPEQKFDRPRQGKMPGAPRALPSGGRRGNTAPLPLAVSRHEAPEGSGLSGREAPQISASPATGNSGVFRGESPPSSVAFPPENPGVPSSPEKTEAGPPRGLSGASPSAAPASPSFPVLPPLPSAVSRREAPEGSGLSGREASQSAFSPATGNSGVFSGESPLSGGAFPPENPGAPPAPGEREAGPPQGVSDGMPQVQNPAAAGGANESLPPVPAIGRVIPSLVPLAPGAEEMAPEEAARNAASGSGGRARFSPENMVDAFSEIIPNTTPPPPPPGDVFSDNLPVGGVPAGQAGER